MPIDRCVCFNVTFREMAEHARAHGGGLDGLRERFGCGRGCALCVPYIRAMLASGQTSFAVDAPLPVQDVSGDGCQVSGDGGQSQLPIPSDP